MARGASSLPSFPQETILTGWLLTAPATSLWQSTPPTRSTNLPPTAREQFLLPDSTVRFSSPLSQRQQQLQPRQPPLPRLRHLRRQQPLHQRRHLTRPRRPTRRRLPIGLRDLTRGAQLI